MIAEAMSAYEGIKAALDIAKGISALRTQTEINQAVIGIQTALIEAQSATFDDKQTQVKLVSQIADLNQKLADHQNWEAEKARYILTKSEVGTFTYELRPESANGEIHHSLCTNCFGNRKKSILHGIRLVGCQACGQKIYVKKEKPVNFDGY